MMKLRTILNVFAFILICFANLNAQSENGRSRGYWTLGINGGWAYQSADVKSDFKGYGLGVTLAKNLYYQPNHLLNFDVRGRFLFANMYGLDSEKFTGILNNTNLNGSNELDYTTLGYVYQNYNTKLGELALEGVIGFNKMRERHNWELSLYGGLGLDIYQTRIDQYDNINNTDYVDAYKNLEGQSNKKSKLKNDIFDQDYETVANEDGGLNANFMPSVGFDLNYWFTPRFALGIGHRMTFAKTDLLDGSQWKVNDTKSEVNDIYHYTNIGMRWLLNKNRKEKLPEITYSQPRENPYYSRNSKVDIRGQVKNVSDPNNISCYYNGQNIRYDYFGGNLTTYVRLKPGRNEFTTTASNHAGSVTESMVIYYQTENPDRGNPTDDVDEYDVEIEDKPTVNAPRIKFINPRKDYLKTSRANYDLKVMVSNTTQDQVDLFINGRPIHNFIFRNQHITKSISLKNGTNEILVKAKNRGGRTEKIRHIILEKNIINDIPNTNPNTGSKPSVTITDPTTSPYETRKTSFVVKANIRQIKSKSEITFLVNGKRQTRFDYNTKTGKFSGKVILRVGSNNISVQAKNRRGRAEDNVTIKFKKISAPLIRKPTVKITSASKPTSNPLAANSCKSVILAEIKNISSKNDIIFKVDGNRVTNFSFKNSQFNATIDLGSGENIVSIAVSNKIGRDSDRVTVTCKTIKADKPTIAVHKPRNNSTTKVQKIKLDATVKNVSSKSDIQVFINNNKSRDYSYSSGSKKLTANVNLKSGRNTIKIIANNQHGKAEKTITVNYKKPYLAVLPKVTILSPKTGLTIKIKKSPFKAKIENATKSQITLKVNGRSQNFSFARNILGANLSLKAGKNTIVVTAKNKDGNDEDIITIQVKEKIVLPKPVILNTDPSERTKNLPSKVELTAFIKNIANSDDIQVKVNGKQVKNIGFNKRSKKMEVNISLKSGNNSIEIIATNPSGKATKKLTLKRPRAIATVPHKTIDNKPTIVINSISKPTSNPFSPDVFKSAILVTITDVKFEESISLKVNGKSVKGIKYSTTTNKMNASIPVIRGKNIIEITAENKAGTVSITHNYKY